MKHFDTPEKIEALFRRGKSYCEGGDFGSAQSALGDSVMRAANTLRALRENAFPEYVALHKRLVDEALKQYREVKAKERLIVAV